ncbi:hypothetical protein MYX65_05160 [Acidobacteria bacterium AH-259-L09]|nr:hypothetical protein [Acidobacteria bacterium AH-259-L09]
MSFRVSRREFVTNSALALPAAGAIGLQGTDTPPRSMKPMRIVGLEAIWLSKPLKERFWMSLRPIGGYRPKATRLILKVHTDAGITGYGEGRGGAELLKKGFQELILGEDPFMVKRIWNRMFKTTISRESAIKG